MIKIEKNDKLVLKKGHPCGANLWLVERVGADVKLKCTGCGRNVMVERPQLLKRIKRVIKYNEKVI